jgi:hypothetical protein
MELFLEIGSGATTPLFDRQYYDLCLSGLVLQGAKYSPEKQFIEFSEELNDALPTCYLKWRLKKSLEQPATTGKDRKDKNADNYSYETIKGFSMIKLPIYYNDNRKQLMNAAYVAVASKHSVDGSLVPNYQWAQRSVAIVLQTSMQ